MEPSGFGKGVVLQRHGSGPSAARQALGSLCPRLVLLLAALMGAAATCLAQVPPEKAGTRLQEVIVQAKRQVPDEEVTSQVQQALRDNPWIFAEHISVTTRNGVVRVEGIVGDTGERFRILRLCWKIPGARRVVDALELLSNDADGG